jgi:PAS domain S-box-containing protein
MGQPMNLLPRSIFSLDILSQLSDAVIAIDLEGRILFWNQGAVRLYSWTEDEALGQNAHRLFNTRSAEPIEPLIDLLLREGRWEGELTRHSRSGEPIDVLSRWSLIRNPEGAPVARLLIDTDLTETRLRFHQLRIAEEQAREAAAAAANRESLLGCLLDGISDCAYLKDCESRYIAVNAATASFFGKAQEEMLGKTDAELFSPHEAREILAQDKQVLATGNPFSIEEEVSGPHGARLFHTIKAICRDRNGQVIGLVGLSRDVGARKQLELALKQRERELTEAHRIAGVGTWRWDRATDSVTWSDEIYRIYGMERGTRPASFAEIKSNPDRPLSHQRFIEAFERAFLFGEPYAMDLEIKRPDGTTRWIVARGEPDTWQDGEVTSLRGTVIEITERKRLELEVRERERQLTESHRIAKIGTWRWVRKTDTTTWSAETFRLFGLDPAEGAPGFDRLLHLHAPSSARRIAAAVDRAVRFGEPYECDVEVVCEDGSVRWISARGEVESWEDDQVAILRGTVYDITERRLKEDQIALSENRYRSLVHASTQIVWVSNPEGGQTGRIPEWQAFTGQSDAEVLGYGWADAIHPDDRESTVNAWLEATRNDSTFTLEHRLLRHDGIYRHMVVRAVPVHDTTGKIVEWVGTHTDITEPKTAQNELRIAHERLQNVMDSITDGLAILDRDLRYTYYNKNGAQALGLRPEDIVGNRLGDIFPQNRTNVVANQYRRALETGQPCHFEVQHGAPLNLWAEVHCYPSAQGLTVYYREISERKRTEAALRASESRFRKLFESHLMGIAFPDRFGAFKEGNEEFLRISGYTRSELEAGLVRWDTMTPPEYAALDAEHIAEAADRGACTPYEKEYIRKDGTRVPILCGYALLEGSQDEYIGIVLDISRQRAAEAGLREREQRFRLLAESLPQLVWITDPVGSLTYLNTRFLDYCGIAAEQMIGFDWSLILHPEEEESVRRTWAHSVQTGEPYLIELRLRAQDGSFRYFLARALPMRNEAGEIHRWVGSCTDIHDQKLAEEALRRSEKLAATGRLAASIAHEINNPLSSVTNCLYLALQDPNLSAETRSFLQNAERELNRVTHITTQTLRFHRQSKAASLIDVSDTMESVLTLFGPRLMARNINVHRELEPGANILCFDDELRQVFANLVSNSLDALADGERLRVRVRTVSGGIRVTVADTGCGIPAQVRRRIFEPFFSTKDTTGIGLGLWVSDGILRKHRARLALRSTTDPVRHGTAISIFLPLGGVTSHPEGSGNAT